MEKNDADSSSRKLRLGVSGLGRAFTLMLPTFLQDPRIELVAACDPREEARQQFARDFDAPVYADINELVENSHVEAVYIASPHQYHAAQTCAVADMGKHVLVEKPMALSLAECDRMIEDCRRNGVQLIVGHCHSFDTPYLETRKLIETGELGRVKMIQATNFTDFLYRPRRPEELVTQAGGGVVFSQAAHQVDVVRLLAGSRVTRIRAILGSWDPQRPTEGAYTAMMWFEEGAFASLTYSGYGHFDSDEWCGWISEMGMEKKPENYGSARRKLAASTSPQEEAWLKAAATFGGALYQSPNAGIVNGPHRSHQHFGPVIVSCEGGDLRPLPDAVWVYADDRQERRELSPATVPRFEVMDELYDAAVFGKRPIHDGLWAKSTLEVCLAMLTSSREGRDVLLDQ
jgi:phthalate 4,5-cis-dihydrodiol dehydrogenase